MTSPDSPSRLEDLTREYSRFSRSAGGLAAACGGLMCLLSYLAGGLMPASPLLHTGLVLMPLLWLIAKQIMATRYYQRWGQVEEIETAQERQTRHVFTGFTALASLMIVVGALTGRAPLQLTPWSLTSVAYVVVVLSLPLIVWKWLRTPLDFVVGVFLLSQAALAFIGHTYPLWSTAVVFPFAALIMIAAGISDHRKFLKVRAEIRRIVQSRQVDE